MGLLDAAKQWMTPERSIAMQGLGLGLSQMAQGQPANLSPAYAALQQRQQSAQMRKVMDTPGLLDRFTPEQQAALAAMPESLAVPILMESLFAPSPEPRVIADGSVLLGSDGQVIYENTKEVGPTTTINVGQGGINYGDPPTDMAWLRNPDGTVKVDEKGVPMAAIVSGSPGDRKAIADLTEMAAAGIDRAETDTKRTESTARKADVVLEDIARARELVEAAPFWNPATGFGAGTAAGVGGSNAANLRELTATIRANIGFDRLTQMREESPTGGALGQVAVQELQMLQAVLGSLEQSQSPEQFVHNLNRLEEIWGDIAQKAAAYPNAGKYGFGGTTDAPTAPGGDLDPDELKWLEAD
jgi:hypothetical protein